MLYTSVYYEVYNEHDLTQNEVYISVIQPYYNITFTCGFHRLWQLLEYLAFLYLLNP